MPVVYRLTRPKYSPGSTAVPGMGAALSGGRWNSKGVRAVYTSGSIALSALELLVHATGDLPNGLELWQADIPNEFAEINPLPGDWQNPVYQPSVQAEGDIRLSQCGAIVLRVPSVVVPLEWNYVLNPAHAEFAKIPWTHLGTFDFDYRLRPSVQVFVTHEG